MARKGKDIFAILAREHEPALVAFVRACVADGAAVDDIVQETFLAAWRQLKQFDRSRPFIAWLRGIAQNKILEHYRVVAAQRRHVASFTPQMLSKIAEEQDRLTAGAGDTFLDRMGPLRECLDALTTDHREVVDRHYRGRQTCVAIAAELGAHVETVKKRLQRARAELRDCILGKLKAVSTDG